MLSPEQRAEIERLAPVYPGHWMEKFLRGVAVWEADAMARAERLGLAGVTPLRVFDVGCGVPYFLAACRSLGHEVSGLDVPDSMLEATFRIFGLPSYVPFTIYEPQLPAIGYHYDLVTMFGVNLRHKDGRWWQWLQWLEFVRLLLGRVEPGGRLVIQPNTGPHCSALLLDESRWQAEALPARVRIDGNWLVFEKE